MVLYAQNHDGVVTYDDQVTGTRRKLTSGVNFWAQPRSVANVPDTNVAVLDPLDHYGVFTRRTFVQAGDLGARYVSGSEGQMKYIDEFRGVGLTEDLTGKVFHRTIFYYEDTVNPTVWTSLFEADLEEPTQ